MDTLLKDIRYGVRGLLKRPGFTAIVVITLALGIGANTAIFSVVNAVLLKPLPFADSGQLMMVFTKDSKTPRGYVTYPDLQDWQKQTQLFSDLAGMVPQSVNLTGSEEPTRVVGSFVTGNFFKTLKIDAVQGHTFSSEQDQIGAARVVVVSYDTWRNRFGSDAQLVGKTLTLNGQPFTVVGILPESFHFPYGDSDVWMPLQYYPNFTQDRSKTTAGVIGRLKPGASLSQAQAEMNTIAGRLAQQYPATNADRGVIVQRFQEVVVEGFGVLLFVLLGAVGFVLLIGCANVANLLLARAAARQKEFALRAALGASRMRLVRQLLTETVVLALVGGTLGLLAGNWGTHLLVANSPSQLPAGVSPKLDLTVLAFTLGVSILTGLIFGLAPALKFSRPDVHETLKEGGRASGGQSRVRGLFVVTQVALSLILLIGAGLMIRSFTKLLKVAPGFDAANLLTMEYRVPRTKYPEGAQQWNFHKEVTERVRALPGVTSASVILALPYSGNGGTIGFVPLNGPEPPKGQEPVAQRNIADPYYFQTMQIPLISGRVFSEQDRAGGPPVVIINRTMRARYWPNEDPVGRPLRLLDDSIVKGNLTMTIVGVVDDVKHYGLDDQSASQVYVAYAQNPFIFATLVVRTQSDPMNMSMTVRKAVWSVDKDQPVWKVRTLQSLIDNSIGPQRFMMWLLGGLTALALLLASVGLYGVMSYTVTQRTHEIGIRMALGARGADVLKLVVRNGMILVLCGITAGLAGAFVLTRWMATLLFGVTPTDAATFVFVPFGLIAVAMLACLLPARRATKVDPLVALRYE
jgi:putative ABC transport system permease protein